MMVLHTLHNKVFLLDNQWVTDPYDGAHPSSPNWYKVSRGSGMGLVHSGELSDLIFHNRVEHDLESTKSLCHIKWYFRYRDDILFCSRRHHRQQRLEFFQMVKQRAGYYKVICESVSTYSVSMYYVQSMIML